MNFVRIDGSMGQGGGAILRLSAGFSVFLNQPIHIEKIRANRNNPGLRLQHMLGLIALKDLTDGMLTHVKIGTTELKFTPGKDFKSELDIEVRTAGSIALIAQIIQIAAIKYPLNNPIVINIKGGGTFGLGAPDPYYLNNITYNYFKKMGYSCSISSIKNGFYPKGDGAAKLYFKPLKNPNQELIPLNLSYSGNLTKIIGYIIVSENLKRSNVAARINNSIIKKIVENKLIIPNHKNNTTQEISLDKSMFDIKTLYIKSLSSGVGVSIFAKFDSGIILGSGTVLGKRGLSSEKVGINTAVKLIKQITSGATVDSFLADQIIPLLYICNKASSIIVSEVTSHMKANIDLLNIFRPRKYSIKKIGNAWKFKYH